VKVSNRFRFSREWTMFAAVLVGTLAGALVGRESIFHTINTRVGNYGDQIEQRSEELATEIATTLERANASPYPACSPDDLSLLRRLTFAARFLKDVGRLQDGSFLCSATSGNLPGGLPLQKPDVTTTSGATIYQNYALKLQGGARAGVVAYRNTDVVLSPDVFSEFPQGPILYEMGFFDHKKLPRTKTVTLEGAMKSVSEPAAAFESEKTVRVGDTLYRGRCSPRYGVCSIVHISMQEVWQQNRALLYAYIATGTAAGMACALALLMAGRKRRSHTNQLKRAILMGKLSVAYQPIVELGSHRIVGAEALARWTDEDGDSIRPETIIALAEAEGFVSEITRFVLTRSLEELGMILEDNPGFHLNINLAPSDLADPRLLLLLDEKLNNSSISAENLTFELTERATADRELAVAAIRRLRQRGHSVFIDDFGTGYSNLAYLTELNVDGIKINRSFIATIGTESVTASILPQILGVARALSLKVVVQGIEREEQATYFSTSNPSILGQGWFFGLPIPARSLMYLCAEKTE
jgi:sensor c-di-GMP phosphodiesterase-like protein